jgi:hypothetical protein
MIGSFEFDAPTALITTTPPGILTSAFFGFQGAYVSATTLANGKGYWVKASAGGVLHLASGGLKVAEVEGSEHPGIQGVQIRISDSRLSSFVLNLTDAEEVDGRYELPPVPPADLFDVRFSSQQYVERLDSADHLIMISSAEYPVTIAASNLQGLTLRIRDGAGGGFPDAILKEGGSVVITPHVSILRVKVDGYVMADMPDEFNLSQNYPNPFNPRTVISCQWPVVSHVKLVVYDVLGRVVGVLIDGVREPGRYEIPFDATNLASGVYVYRINAGEYVETRRMIVVR